MKKKNRIERYIEEFGEDLITTTFNNSKTRTEFVNNMGFAYSNGTTTRFVNECISRFKLDTSHFDIRHKQRKYKDIEIICPVCGKQFTTKDGGSDAKVTCSHACANTYFRSGNNNGNYIDGTNGARSYRTICFEYHEKKCIICGEDKIVAVHHMDHDHNNESPDNLIPLCPTHHQYMHSSFKHLIKDQVNEYITKFGRLL